MTQYKTIAEFIAAAEKIRTEQAASTARKSQAANSGSVRSPGSPSGKAISPADAVDLRDDFDFAIESVETARRSASGDPTEMETMAVSLLMGKRQIPRAKAGDLIKRAVKYLDN